MGTRMIARSRLPVAPVAHVLLVARRRLPGCATRLSQSLGGDDRAWSFSSEGISSPLASLVNIANIDLRGGSEACREFSIRLRTRCWRAGRPISQLRSGDRPKAARSF
jgi:hypothetical protein